MHRAYLPLFIDALLTRNGDARMLWSLMWSKPVRPCPLAHARKAYADAKARGDTRDIHRAVKDLRKATHDALRAELGR